MAEAKAWTRRRGHFSALFFGLHSLVSFVVTTSHKQKVLHFGKTQMRFTVFQLQTLSLRADKRERKNIYYYLHLHVSGALCA